MKQSARSAVPRARWRGAALAPLLAVVALALGLLSAGPAAAAPAAPNLGSVRQLTVDLDVTGGAPLGLDLSGAGILFTNGATTGTCLTHGLGRCDVRWASDGKVTGSGTSDLRLPAGTYTVTQVADLPVPGLQPQPGTLATVSIGDHWNTFLGWRISERTNRLEVPNTSLYRHTITARIVDEATGAGVRDAKYRLTGPGFPGLLGRPAVYDAGVERTNRNGELSFGTLLRAQVPRPGTWTLTPVDVPAAYVAVPVSVELTAAAPGGNTWHVGPFGLAQPAAPLPPEVGSATLTLQASGPVPADLNLSGAEFELSGAGTDGATGTCVTDAAGSCSIEVVPDGGASSLPTDGGAIALPAGTYAVQQTSAPDGLTRAEEIAPLELCVSRNPEACTTTRTVTNSSNFLTRTEVHLLSAGEPVPGVEVTLSGPGFEAEPLTTDEDGRGAWTGWFLPGEWSFAVAGQPEPFPMTMAPGQGDPSLPWRVELTLPSVGQPGGTDGDTGGNPTTPTAPPSATPPASPEVPGPAAPDAAVPSPPSVPGPLAGPAGTGAGAGTGTTAPRVVAPVEQPQDDAVPSAVAAPGTASSPAPPTAGGGAGQVFVAEDDGPALETESSSRLMTAGLVTGVGILFVALVLTGYGVLRSRTRRAAAVSPPAAPGRGPRR